MTSHNRPLTKRAIGALIRLSEWMRERTGPSDGTLAMLKEAQAVLADAQRLDLLQAPSPWHVSNKVAPDAAAFPLAIYDAEDWSVAYVTGTADDARTTTNAQLLAAAPALRDALDNSVDTLQLIADMADRYHRTAARKDAAKWLALSSLALTAAERAKAQL